MIIDCISDLHGEFPKLEGDGDLLIIAGDLVANDTEPEYFDFFDWVLEQKYREKVVVAGNHDMRMQVEAYDGPKGEGEGAFSYLCDSGTEFDGMKIWGSPWTRWFHGINPKCSAFTKHGEHELRERWEKIPHDTNILVTHSPTYGVLDKTYDGRHVGSTSLHNYLYSERVRLKLHVFGHIHESYGRAKIIDFSNCISVNASHMDVSYFPCNPPVRVIL